MHAHSTPSLSRPFEIYTQVAALRKGLLGEDKWAYGRSYCQGACACVCACVRESVCVCERENMYT